MKVPPGPLTIDSATRQVRVYGVPITLSPKEFDLLTLLAAAPGTVVERDRILAAVWGPRFDGHGKTVDFHIAALRGKLGEPGWIENRRGVGFRLVLPHT